MATQSAQAPKLSIVVPTYNEEGVIESTLSELQLLRERGQIEVIVSDGGSEDRTRELALPLSDLFINEAKGRARQMNCGARAAKATSILFLHADTRLPVNFFLDLDPLLDRSPMTLLWGFFPVRLTGDRFLLRVVEKSMNLRSRLSSIATGDQAVFVSRKMWEQVGGFSDIPLMEDIDFSRRARKLSRPCVQRQPLLTSSRRWEEKGVVATIVLMWRLRWLYFWGVRPEKLEKLYR